MRRGTIFAAVVIALLGVVGSAQAGAPDGAAGPWADYVVVSHQGFALQGATGIPGGAFLPGRSDPQAAVGPAETLLPGDDPNPPFGTFFSLGFGGDITLGFDNPICNQPGTDLAIDVREITIENYPPERAQVYVSEDGVTFLLAGTVTKDGTVPMPAGLTVANFVKLIDVSVPADFIGRPNNPDGFDLDGVRALNSSCPPGKIEICKAAANGMSNRPFQFSLNGGTPFTVRGGRCSGPITTIPGLNTVVELLTTPPTDVAAVTVRPTSRLISTDLPNRTAVVRVVSGSTAANESKVTFTNQPGGGTTGELKICKLTETPAFFGRQFSFTVNGGPAFSTEANPAFDEPSAWSCRLAGSFPVGSIVTVDEIVPPGVEITYLDSDPGDCLLDDATLDTNEGTARFRIGPGVCIALYQNDAVAPTGTGFVEVCKDAGFLEPGYRDPAVTGPFDFTIDEADGSTQDITVLAGQCSAPIVVAAGIVRVTEHARAGFMLVDVVTIPNDRLLDSNLINRTADVEVPTSDNPNDETQVHFVNLAERGQLKLCKALGPGSSVFVGRDFDFEVDNPGSSDIHVTITAAASTQCKVVGYFPIGAELELDESIGDEPDAEFIRASGPGCSLDGDGDLECSVTIAPGINTVTITNQALGKLEICKRAIPGVDVAQTHPSFPVFQFRVNGGPRIDVRMNRCSLPMLVPIGDYTITEEANAKGDLYSNYEVVGITTSPPERLLSSNNLTRTARVHVPYGTEGETRVDYENRIRRAQIKICKHIDEGSEDALGSRTFDFTLASNNANGTGNVSFVRGGECQLLTTSGVPRDIPILTTVAGALVPTTVTVTELIQGNYHVSNFDLQGNRGSKTVNGNSVTFTLGPNTNTVHVTNRFGTAPAG